MEMETSIELENTYIYIYKKQVLCFNKTWDIWHSPIFLHMSKQMSDAGLHMPSKKLNTPKSKRGRKKRLKIS